jgi:hypothetical protein
MMIRGREGYAVARAGSFPFFDDPRNSGSLMSHPHRMGRPGILLYEPRPTLISCPLGLSCRIEVYRSNLEITRLRTQSTFPIPTDLCSRSRHMTFRNLRVGQKRPSHALPRTAASHRGCNRRAPWPPSLCLGR